MRSSLPALISTAALLFCAAPAFACDADGSHQTQKKASDDVLAPVDQVLSATCSCSSPADCTCKKGECKCKKCKHHHRQDGVKKTQLLEPLNGKQLTPALPQNARREATGGTMI